MVARKRFIGNALHQAFFIQAAVLQQPLLNRQVNRQVFTQGFFQAGNIPLVMDGFRRHIVFDDAFHHLADHFFNVFLQRIFSQNVIALRVNNLTLLVIDVIVFQQVFADIEVARLNFSLRVFNRARDHFMLNRFIFLQPHGAHHRHHAVTGENAHQVIFKRQVEARNARVTLTAGAAAELVVNPARFVAL